MDSSMPNAGRKQRRLKNYLIDAPFQLKYTAYLVVVALGVSLGLGVVLWRTSASVLAESQKAVAQGERIVGLGREVVKESQKVSEVVKMNIVKDPVYGADPELAETFKADAKKRDELLTRQQQQLEQQASELKAQSQQLASEQRTVFIALLAGVLILSLSIGLAGILVTHRIAGPVFKMKRQLRDLGHGKLTMPAPLRKGDELVHFFSTFEDMVRSLRSRQEREISELEELIVSVKDHVPAEDVDRFEAFRDRMRAELG